MKNIFIVVFSFFTIIILFSCKETSDSFIINGEVNESLNDKIIYLFVNDFFKNRIKILDSNVVKKRKFQFKGVQKQDVLAYLICKSEGRLFSQKFVLKNGTIKLTINPNNDNQNILEEIINKTIVNKNVNKFINEINLLEEQKIDLENQIKYCHNNSKKLEELKTHIHKIHSTLNDQLYQFIKLHPYEYLFLFMIYKKFYQQDSISFNSMHKVVKLFNQINVQLNHSSLENVTKNIINNRNKIAIGVTAPNFSSISPQGKIIKLCENLGKKVTIIEFWASWCPPCRKENSNVVKIHNAFKDKGLNIISISLDEFEKDWKKAIKFDRMEEWIHVSNLESFNDPLVQEYQVQSIPFIYVLDASGKIVAKNLYGSELYKKIEELTK